MKTSKILTLAKKELAKTAAESDFYTGTKEKYVCLAIRRAGDKCESAKDADAARRVVWMVESRLSPYATLESWLTAKGCLTYDHVGLDEAMYARIQQHRHAWLDEMIAEFKRKGD